MELQIIVFGDILGKMAFYLDQEFIRILIKINYLAFPRRFIAINTFIIKSYNVCLATMNSIKSKMSYVRREVMLMNSCAENVPVETIFN